MCWFYWFIFITGNQEVFGNQTIIFTKCGLECQYTDIMYGYTKSDIKLDIWINENSTSHIIIYYDSNWYNKCLYGYKIC